MISTYHAMVVPRKSTDGNVLPSLHLVLQYYPRNEEKREKGNLARARAGSYRPSPNRSAGALRVPIGHHDDGLTLSVLLNLVIHSLHTANQIPGQLPSTGGLRQLSYLSPKDQSRHLSLFVLGGLLVQGIHAFIESLNFLSRRLVEQFSNRFPVSIGYWPIYIVCDTQS